MTTEKSRQTSGAKGWTASGSNREAMAEATVERKFGSLPMVQAFRGQLTSLHNLKKTTEKEQQ